MRFSSFAVLLSLLASSNAFTVVPASRTAPATKLFLMTQEESEKVFSQANDCVEGECSIDEVDDLIQVLKEQQKELSERVDKVMEMINQLEHVNEKDERKVDEIRETVRALFRVFQLGDKASGNDYPSLSKPTGWSGDVGDGPKTAWDALPPKKWTAPKK